MNTWTSKIFRKEDKIYRGAYTYHLNEYGYAEEVFDVYRDKKEHGFNYISEAIVKVRTGEILNLHVEYTVNREYLPTYVYIDKIMGNESTKETFEYNPKRNFIKYHFSNSKGEVHEEELMTAPKFHIATPTAASSMTFLRSKKFDVAGKNIFNILVGHNLWEFKAIPKFKSVVIERASVTAEKITIDGQNVQATHFKMCDEGLETKNAKSQNYIKILMSQHGAIPYVIKTEDGTRIQIKYLNDLVDKE